MISFPFYASHCFLSLTVSPFQDDFNIAQDRAIGLTCRAQDILTDTTTDATLVGDMNLQHVQSVNKHIPPAACKTDKVLNMASSQGQMPSSDIGARVDEVVLPDATEQDTSEFLVNDVIPLSSELYLRSPEVEQNRCKKVQPPMEITNEQKTSRDLLARSDNQDVSEVNNFNKVIGDILDQVIRKLEAGSCGLSGTAAVGNKSSDSIMLADSPDAVAALEQYLLAGTGHQDAANKGHLDAATTGHQDAANTGRQGASHTGHQDAAYTGHLDAANKAVSNGLTCSEQPAMQCENNNQSIAESLEPLGTDATKAVCDRPQSDQKSEQKASAVTSVVPNFPLYGLNNDSVSPETLRAIIESIGRDNLQVSQTIQTTTASLNQKIHPKTSKEIHNHSEAVVQKKTSVLTVPTVDEMTSNLAHKGLSMQGFVNDVVDLSCKKVSSSNLPRAVVSPMVCEKGHTQAQGMVKTTTNDNSFILDLTCKKPSAQDTDKTFTEKPDKSPLLLDLTSWAPDKKATLQAGDTIEQIGSLPLNMSAVEMAQQPVMDLTCHKAHRDKDALSRWAKYEMEKVAAGPSKGVTSDGIETGSASPKHIETQPEIPVKLKEKDTTNSTNINAIKERHDVQNIADGHDTKTTENQSMGAAVSSTEAKPIKRHHNKQDGDDLLDNFIKMRKGQKLTEVQMARNMDAKLTKTLISMYSVCLPIKISSSEHGYRNFKTLLK